MTRAPEPADLRTLISALSDPDSSIRERAATELFRRGRELARVATRSWLADSELSATFVLDASQFPETTVGIAVTPDNFERIRVANRSPRLADVPPDQDAKEFELHLPHNIRLDILTTKDPAGAGAIARYLRKTGEGIQQIELLTRDIDLATNILRSKFGVQPINPATRAGADATRVNFFLVAAAGAPKTLIELVQTSATNSR